MKDPKDMTEEEIDAELEDWDEEAWRRYKDENYETLEVEELTDTWTNKDEEESKGLSH